MSLVALSIAMLLVAPLLAAALLRRPALAAGLDGFVLVAVGGVVALHVVPQSAELAGPLAIAFAALGLFLPIALHRLDDAVLSRGGARRARDGALLVVFLAGLLVHALFDGAALGDSSSSSGSHALALGVILHRVPVGLALWVVARPKLGTVRTLVVVAVYAGGTIAGAAVGAQLLAHASAPSLAVFQAFVAGSILHIVAESPALPLPRARPTPFLLRGASLRAPPPSKRVRAAGLVGSAVAMFVLWLTERAHDASEAHHVDNVTHVDTVNGVNGAPAFVDALLDIALLCAPAALLSFVVVGVLYTLLPDAAPLRARTGQRARGAWLDAMRGAAAGLPHPLCSCAVAPLYDELVDSDAPPAAARAFLVAAPALGVPAVFLSARLLGLPFTFVRVAGAALLAIAAGWSAMVARSASTSTSSHDASDGEKVAKRPAVAQRLLHGLRHGVVDAVDHVGPWLLVGVAVAAAVRVNVAPTALADVSSSTQVGVAALASLPLYLCAAGITPIAFALLGKGASTGAVLAFLLVGPTTSLPTFALVKRHHGAAASVALAVVVALVAALLGLAVDAMQATEAHGSMAFAATAREVASAQGPVTIVQMASLALLGSLLAASFVRQGVRGFLVQVMSPQHSHAGDDAHGPHCDHDHGPALAPPPVVRIAVPFDPRGKT